MIHHLKGKRHATDKGALARESEPIASVSRGLLDPPTRASRTGFAADGTKVFLLAD